MEHIHPYLLLTISVSVTLLYGSLRNQYSKNRIKTRADYYAFNCMSSIFSVLILVLFLGDFDKISGYTIWLGLFFGIATVCCTIFNMQALEIGPMSYTTVIISASMILPAMSGGFFWREKTSFWQYAGLALIIVSLIFSIDKKAENKHTSVRWLLLCLGAFLFSGAIGIMQKLHQSSVFKDELNAFLLIAFITSAILSGILYTWYTYGTKKDSASGYTRVEFYDLLLAAVSGVCIALANIFNLYLSGVMDSVIFFPIVNGGNVILSTIVGVVLFKEKLTKNQWIGLLVGVFSIFLICNIF